MRNQGVCNCQFREKGSGSATCKLDNKRCKVVYDGRVLFCRGWLPDSKPSKLHIQYLKQERLF